MTTAAPRPTLLVHCELDAATDARTALAVDLARRTGARLVGAAAAQPPVTLAGAPRMAGGLLAAAERDLVGALEVAGKAFCERSENIETVSWRSALEPAAHFLAREACAADLVIAGPQRGAPASQLSIDTAALVLTAGRPVLVTPDGLDRLDLGRVLVAWKETREARRVLLDALPLLAMAQSVLVVSVTEEGGSADRLEAVRDWLSDRGVRVQIERRPAPGRSVADDLLDLSEAVDAGLIVAGAYSRGPLRERLFGGVTRELLHRGRAARLLSH